MEDEVVGAGTRGGGVAAVADVLPTEADPEDSPLLAPVTAGCFQLLMSLHSNNSVNNVNNTKHQRSIL